MAPRGLLPIDYLGYIGHEANPLSEALPCLQFQADPIVRCLLSSVSKQAQYEHCLNLIGRCAGQNTHPLLYNGHRIE